MLEIFSHKASIAPCTRKKSLPSSPSLEHWNLICSFPQVSSFKVWFHYVISLLIKPTVCSSSPPSESTPDSLAAFTFGINQSQQSHTHFAALFVARSGHATLYCWKFWRSLFPDKAHSVGGESLLLLILSLLPALMAIRMFPALTDHRATLRQQAWQWYLSILSDRHGKQDGKNLCPWCLC